jgi:hypothetical protein
VAIYELLTKQGVFTPEDVAILGAVFEDVLKSLGLVDRQDAITAAVALRLIEIAKAGMRDPERLKALTVQAFTQQQQQQQQQREPERFKPRRV